MNGLPPDLVVAASILVPGALGLAAAFQYRRWQDRDRRRFGNDTAGRVIARLVLFLFGPYFLTVWALQRMPWTGLQSGWPAALHAAAFLLMATWAIRRIVGHGIVRRRALAGLQAEWDTAQELNRLRATGCTVLHDVPAGTFNLDHVVIGPQAVYLVETKSVRKPRGAGAQGDVKVAFDGERLRFPDFVSRTAVRQAHRKARWLASYLRQTTDQAVPVIATLALPGCSIDATPSSNIRIVRVFNPAAGGADFMADAGRIATIDPATVASIVRALRTRHRVAGG